MELTLIGGLWTSLVVAFFKKTRICTLVSLICLLILALADQTRWQPWVYQYGLMLIPFLWLAGKNASAPFILKTQRFIVIAIYFWSGFHKRGEEFATIWKGSVAKPLLDLLDSGGSLHQFVANASGWIPWVEMALAVALIFSCTRWLGIAMACGMHLGVLILIGPLMGNNNEVIWPWNIAMIALVITLFRAKEREPLSESFRLSNIGAKVTFASLALLIGVMPWYSTKRKWDNYLSFHLYSGKGHRCVIILFPAGEKKLPEEYAQFYVNDPPKLRELSIDVWAFRELKVPAVSDDRVLLQWCKVMMETGKFTNRDCFIHHDASHNQKKGILRHKPSIIEKMKKLPLLPKVAETQQP